MKRDILRRAVLTAAFYLILIVVFFAIGEAYARRAYNNPGASGFMTRDEVFHHIPPPYCKGTMFSKGDFDLPFTLNNRGMRGPSDYRYDKEGGVFRIAVLGDSFTFGMGVESGQTSCAALERLLSATGPKRCEVMNFGVCSYSPLLEYIYLKEEVSRYEPDLVILMLDESDLQDDYFYEPHIVRDGPGNIVGCNTMTTGGRFDMWQWCLKHSRLLYILDQRLFESLRKIKAIGITNYISNKLRKKRNKQEIILNRDIDNIRFDKFIMYREGKNKDVVMRHWARTAGYIAMIKDYLYNKGIKLLLVIYPYGHQVSGGQWAEGRAYWAFEKNKVYDPSGGFAIIEDFAERNGIGVINLYDAFIRHKDEHLFFDVDGHWTARAHEVAAGAIFESDLFRREVR